MKKLISMMLCIVMVLSMVPVLAACGKSESSSANASDSEIEYITEAEATDSSIPYTEPAASDSDIS